ncbi:histidine kinase [Rhizobium halophytocola]|uniref:Histidine kinase n=1 Tax=Rhizobium halophytocola TaxID=735519 RepID=A0ABS4DZR9_9HYPH|nr:histidine kinase [Rhizobium halophytocola]MBP1851191.1 hypothetical protein [Rhizobium halophytocola]
MKALVAAAFATLLLAGAALADTLKFPSDDPVASISAPDGWTLEETETGAQILSADDAIYIYIDVADAETSDKVIDDAVAFLDDNGVSVDSSTEKQSEDTVNGMKMSNFDWDGTDEDGPVSIGLSVSSPKTGKLLVITYWGSKGDQDKHANDLGYIINSLKAE